MNSEGFEQWFKVNRNLLNPASDLGRATADILRRTTQQNLEILSENFARLSDQLKRLSTVKKPEELVSYQKDVLNENVSTAVETIQRIVDISMANFEDISKLCGSLREQPTVKAGFKTERAEKVDR